MDHYRLKPWIHIENLDWDFLSSNPRAIELLRQNPQRINWIDLSRNPSPGAIVLLLENLDRLNDWWGLSMNPNPEAIKLLRQNPELIDWGLLSKNKGPEAIKLLRENEDSIDWEQLSTNPAAMDVLRTNPERIDLGFLSSNPNPEAISLLRQNPELINWGRLSSNPSPGAIELLRQNPERIDWEQLSSNPEAIKLLMEHPERIDWDYLSSNPSPGAIKLLQRDPERINWELLSENEGIFDDINSAAKNIQKGFRRTRGYAEWEGNPNREYRRIKAEGLFKNDHSSDNSRYNNETGVWGPNAFGKKKAKRKIKHPKKYYGGLNMKKLSKRGIKKSDPRFFYKVENLSKKKVGRSGKSVMYKGKKTPVETWCREYGRQFYDRECKRDLRDAGIKVFNSFGKVPVIKLFNNKGKNPKKLKAFNTGYIIAVKLNGKTIKTRYLRSRYKGFRFSVKIHGKNYHFNAKGSGRVTLYRNANKTFKEKRSVKKRSKKVKRTRRTTGGSKRVSTTRKSPEQSATLFPVGTTKTGNDGNRWVVKKTSNGVKRWVKNNLKLSRK